VVVRSGSEPGLGLMAQLRARRRWGLSPRLRRPPQRKSIAPGV